MTARAEAAIEGLERLAQLFETAALHVHSDTKALSETLDKAARVLDSLNPAMASVAGGSESIVVERAARLAQERHGALARAIERETARIERELSRLAMGSRATSRYAAARPAPEARRWIERSA